jgi:hypothetical protein
VRGGGVGERIGEAHEPRACGLVGAQHGSGGRGTAPSGRAAASREAEARLLPPPPAALLPRPLTTAHGAVAATALPHGNARHRQATGPTRVGAGPRAWSAPTPWRAPQTPCPVGLARRMRTQRCRPGSRAKCRARQVRNPSVSTVPPVPRPPRAPQTRPCIYMAVRYLHGLGDELGGLLLLEFSNFLRWPRCGAVVWRPLQPERVNTPPGWPPHLHDSPHGRVPRVPRLRGHFCCLARALRGLVTLGCGFVTGENLLNTHNGTICGDSLGERRALRTPAILAEAAAAPRPGARTHTHTHTWGVAAACSPPKREL